jgi:hypothetical protein
LSLSKNVKRHPELDESENQLYFLRQAYSVLREKGHNLTQKRRRKINIHIGKNMAETYLQNQNMPMFELTLEHFELFDDREFLEKGYFFYMKNRETEKAEKLIRHIPYKESEDIRLRWQNRRRGPIWNN